MNQRIKNLTIVSSCALMLIGIIALPKVSIADEITVSGNGSNSNNSINVTTTQQTAPAQTNSSQVANNTTTNASTGNNTVSNSTNGAVVVKTGDANAATSVTNSANASTLITGCCSTINSTAAIVGNGTGSNNTLGVSSSNTTTVSINQSANISNNYSQYASTGNNSANENNGNVSIKTGDINAQINLKKGPINIVNITIPSEKSGFFELKIAANGAYSQNMLSANESNTTNITVNNSASVITNLKEKYITGNNTTNKNIGNVAIVTGNVLSQINLENGPMNVSKASVNCTCQKEHTKPSSSPVPTPQPTSNNVPVSSSSSSPMSNNSTGSGSSSSGPGSVLGVSTNSLPVTGSYWFFIAFIGNILMMLLGGYLRLRSGRSPGFAYTL